MILSIVLLSIAILLAQISIFNLNKQVSKLKKQVVEIAYQTNYNKMAINLIEKYVDKEG